MPIKKSRFPMLLLIVSLSIFLYAFFQSEVTHAGMKRDLYQKYFLISSVLVVFSLTCFFLSEKVLSLIKVVVGSIVAAFYLFEAYLIVQPIEAENLINVPSGAARAEFDNRTRFEVFSDLITTNPEAAVRVPPSSHIGKDNVDIFPLAGISNAITVNCNESGKFSRYQSDRQGFNNPDTELNAKEFEYILVGDSFTHGSCVNRPNDIASVLRDLTGAPVLNLGYTSNGPLIEYATLREYLPKTVKTVLWLYFEGNDQQELVSEFDDARLMMYLEDEKYKQNLISRQSEIDHLLRLVIERQSTLHEENKSKKIEQEEKQTSISFKTIKQFLKLTRVRLVLVPPIPRNSISDEFKMVMRRAVALTEANNAKLVFVFLPEYWRYKLNYPSGTYDDLTDFINQLGLGFVDIHKEVFEKKEDPLSLFPLRNPGHYTEEGYRLVAEAIFHSTRD
jgi:hypothetical protein